MFQIHNIQFNEKGLVPAIVQDVKTKDVLMLAYMNEVSIQQTLQTGYATYYSRSRQKLWVKGETSGNRQAVKSIAYDCDQDTILMQVEQNGVACHTGNWSCFHEKTDVSSSDVKYNLNILNELYQTIVNRKSNPVEGSYTTYLFDKGIDKILKKVGEESSEVIIGAKNDDTNELVYEISDLVYHVMVLMVEKGVRLDEIKEALVNRREKVRS
ncbi:bifunctional phosphoribosyl-AMP cyclohydrolase/phosphoribosyl-ATP diphosphatase HisIE [Bacillus sp. OAE603]|uniref:bifunctional phosphoribosyl-AMP cyclohydrolase/phosphoribosyl-ATP diphosphatase HisIE n=1 Tax=Gottfriedia sp. OAE603 TaxID=2663872 RepID=UPI00178AF58D